MAVITEVVGDIFSAPAGSILIHACNAKGSWGAGVALAFKNKYPAAFKIYTNHCKQSPPSKSLISHQRSIVGTTLLIPPQESQSPSTPQHWIACLFTSFSYGRAVDSTSQILKNTELAVEDLAKQLNDLRQHTPQPSSSTTTNANESHPQTFTTTTTNSTTQPPPSPSLYAVRINSGKFGVPWPHTKEILQRSSLDITVSRPEGEDEVQRNPIPAAVQRKRALETAESSAKRQRQGDDDDDDDDSRDGKSRRAKEDNGIQNGKEQERRNVK